MESISTRKSERWKSWCECCRVDTEERAAGAEDEKAGDKQSNVGEKVGNGNLTGVMNGDLDPPAEHLVIMVNGIIGSASDWKFAAEHFRKRLGGSVAVHCSACNSSRATFHGVDIMGKRLADEVREIIQGTKGLKKISFVSHSLGGLISRYAISRLYQPGVPDSDHLEATIEGLEPVNFITVATPHVGSRGNQNLPFLFGIQLLEKTAPYLAHWIIGQTGKHLFMTDGNPKKNILPLLRRMVTDCEEGPFFSSLGAFNRRTVYANVIYDHAVGWRTSSLRRKSELPEIRHEPVDKRYPHIVRDEGWVESDSKSTTPPAPCADPVEEEILAGLNQLSWRRVDVSFKGAKAGYQAHNTIQVKNEKIHLEGKDVIDHIIDKHFIQEDSNKASQIGDAVLTKDAVQE